MSSLINEKDQTVNMKNISKLACLPAIMLALSTTAAFAQERSSDSWKWGAEVYFWGASLGGKTTSGGNIDLEIDKILENLKFGAMGAISARKDKWTVFADLIYLDVGDSGTVPVHVSGMTVPVAASIDLKALISTSGVGYRVYNQSHTTLDAVLGVRYLGLKARLDATVPGQPTVREEESGSNWDAVIGLRGKTDLNEKWYLTYYADVGAGDSDSTWQALGAVNYRLEKVDLTLGYRYLDWKLGKFGPFHDLNLSGAFAGVKIPF